ncbi:hypothetical protein ACIA78_31260 [Streptomyces xanthochromogenes]|uniref:hypothetical protein n=1 Tax=Streptomyces xanthochromogenes TaxID=67384 RepID=UPI0034494579
MRSAEDVAQELRQNTADREPSVIHAFLSEAAARIRRTYLLAPEHAAVVPVRASLE